MEAFYYRHEMMFMWLLAAWAVFLLVGATVALARSSSAAGARVIVPSVAAFGIMASLVHELMFGEGVRGLPTVALAATIGGLVWGCAIAGLVSLARRASRAASR